MSNDTYEVTVEIDREIIDWTRRIELEGHEDLEKLFNDIAGILQFFKQNGYTSRTEVRGGMSFEQEVNMERI